MWKCHQSIIICSVYKIHTSVVRHHTISSTTKTSFSSFLFSLFCKMEFEISKRVQSEEGEESLKEEQVCKQLQLKSSETQTQALNKRAVLNRIRDHKCIHKIKSLLLTTAGSNKGSTVDADSRWIDSGDVFSCPWTRLILWHVYVNVCRVCVLACVFLLS